MGNNIVKLNNCPILENEDISQYKNNEGDFEFVIFLSKNNEIIDINDKKFLKDTVYKITFYLENHILKLVLSVEKIYNGITGFTIFENITTNEVENIFNFLNLKYGCNYFYLSDINSLFLDFLFENRKNKDLDILLKILCYYKNISI